MRSFGFKNFRKFEDFPPIDLGSINILVGPNNSGKSTFIKALKLMCYNLKLRTFEQFPIYMDFRFPDSLQGFSYNVPYMNSQNDMEFSVLFAKFSMKMILDNQTLASEAFADQLVKIKHLEYNYYKYDMRAVFSVSENTISRYISFSVDKLKERLSNNALTNNFLKENNGQFEIYGPAGDDCEDVISILFDELRNEVFSETSFDYISNFEVNVASDDIIVNGQEQNDFYIKAIRQYLKLDKCTREKVCCWLSSFGICDDIRIERVDNWYVKADVHSGDLWKPLGLMGTGSRHLFTLFINLASVLDGINDVIFFIEEPEQNLHPALQSKLADLLFEVYESSWIKPTMIIETHSEYLIRRLQVIVSDRVSSHNEDVSHINKEVKVYYFPEDGLPYSMDFRPSGHFLRQFGNGFFDEAGKQYKTILLKSM